MRWLKKHFSRDMVRPLIYKVFTRGILALLAGAFFLWERSVFRDDRDYAQEMVWQHEHFPELDRLYEEGRYEELDERLYMYGQENHDLWEWQYYEEFYEFKDEIREKEKQP